MSSINNTTLNSRLDRINSVNWLKENADSLIEIYEYWFEYLIDDYYLYHLMIATQLKSYRDILNSYKGLSLGELIEELEIELEIHE